MKQTKKMKTLNYTNTQKASLKSQLSSIRPPSISTEPNPIIQLNFFKNMYSKLRKKNSTLYEEHIFMPFSHETNNIPVANNLIEN